MEEVAPTTSSRLIVKLPLQRENPAPRSSQTLSIRGVEAAEIQIIDDEGDLILTVLKAHSQQQTPLRTFKVSSKALSLASPLLNTISPTQQFFQTATLGKQSQTKGLTLVVGSPHGSTSKYLQKAVQLWS
ncbi:hypothetical protein TWF970_007300 [Orbilia oligospora]|uniref:Uncharacterized protein n=1 Tax=Orbilia oligospora TaxID=2813651 RepID=A0A7C8RF93_ORBOL|nr:hypothetical protein TWF970_007300 [Orbilia oligospora]